MGALNQTRVTEFIFLGLTDNWVLEILFFVPFTVTYMLTLLGNFLIVVTIVFTPRLHNPMYFFLSNLSFIDICHSSVTVPKMLEGLLLERKTISFDNCIAQLFFLHLFACSEIFLLTIMAYDRYVAICIPLHYSNVMNMKVCVQLVFALWLGGTIHSLVQTFLTIRLPYCGPNIIDSYFCDVPPVIKLACTDTYLTGILIVSNSGTISLVCFLALVTSYTVILFSLRKQSAEGRRKALSTCSAHFMVVALFFGPCIFLYTRPDSSFSIDKVVSVFYTVVTPLLNPLIYTLRNEEVKTAMKHLRQRRICS
ncbi:olfactory receptor 4E2 [Mus musculus]|jgi:olfactory receptor|uniref:Olfactory receptor 4E2 n=4 Tax=Mus TaxID=862507 RepID=OR4E2_MOUSE|nr:olfactory receptor 4E2 [Mus musculus]Q7TQQ0.1 RecName: Full=Olfactory receptor 4E2; AltName: Full=Odorant receptor 244-3; AltName: Full=Odorant receptor 83; AltName: Full=Olfactory receptor 1509 [Mus musculus]AAI19196.1 Olfactory receptor 1509 [Mus musculus]AAI19200.1 Olfactory receptor 1509 [Mus musculus]AAP71857.1 olfactory receptor Olfr1509 [Mus musculus]EDL42235.1 olfactory receptor 1509 [Mus musculus]|eukprot:NP_065260.2 olfactory receptor 1509 [Mus musculus]